MLLSFRMKLFLSLSLTFLKYLYPYRFHSWNLVTHHESYAYDRAKHGECDWKKRYETNTVHALSWLNQVRAEVRRTGWRPVSSFGRTALPSSSHLGLVVLEV
jgi:hypothetical protein